MHMKTHASYMIPDNKQGSIHISTHDTKHKTQDSMHINAHDILALTSNAMRTCAHQKEALAQASDPEAMPRELSLLIPSATAAQV